MVNTELLPQIEMKAYIGSFPKHMLDLILPFEKKEVID